MNQEHRSAACGAWKHQDGRHAHEFCESRVALPPPSNTCSCWCHQEIHQQATTLEEMVSHLAGDHHHDLTLTSLDPMNPGVVVANLHEQYHETAPVHSHV